MQNRVVEEEVRLINPTLLVGLGGTGREVITRVRRNFVGKYDTVSNFPIVGYFLIDTDATMQHYTPGLRTIVERKIDFSENEVYMATVNNVSQFTQKLNLFPHMAEWLYPNLADIGDLKEGAGAIRPYGRLAFFVHQRRIRGNLADALGSIRSPDGRNMIAERYNIRCGAGVSAYIICSLAGGTGSSMFLDTAFTLKDIAMAEGIPLEIVGFLVMPGLYGKDKHFANGYAALEELEHHTRINNFEVRYEAQANTRVIPVPPFDYCYLIHNENEAGVPVKFGDREDMFELLAENIFLDFSNDDFAAHKRRIRVNFADQVSDIYSPGIASVGTAEEEGWSRRYMSLGYTSISYPADRIISCCAYKLAANVFEDWGKLADVEVSVAGVSLADFVYVPESGNRGFLADLGMYESLEDAGKHDILGWITRPGTGSSMLDEIREWAQNLQRRVEDDAHMRDDMSVVQFLDQQVKLYEARFIGSEQEPDPAKRGEFDRRMDSNIELLLYGGMLAGSEDRIIGLLDQTARGGEIVRGKIHNHVAGMVNDKFLSSAHMKQVLGEVKNRLGRGDDSYKASILRQMGDEQAETGLYKDLKHYENQMNSFRNSIDGLLNEREDHASWPDGLPWNRWRKDGALRYDDRQIFDVLTSYRESLVAYFHTKARIAARRKTLNICDQIIDYVDSLIAELNRVDVTIRTLHSQAMAASDEFRGKIEVSLLQNIYDPEDMEEIYYPMGNNVDNIDFHSDRIIDRLTEMRGGGDRVTIVDLPELVDRFSLDDVMSVVTSHTRSVFEPAIKNLNIIEGVYEKKYPEAEASKRGLFLRNTYDYGKCWMVLNEKLPNLRLDPSNHRSYIVGRHADPARRQTHSLFDREMQRMRDPVLDPQIQLFQTSDPSKILISTELAGFPLAAFSGINSMREKYEAEYIKMGSTLHIDKNDFKYRDIIPVLDEVAMERINEIRSCFVLGMILGVLKPGVSTADSQIVYEFTREAHLKEIAVTLGVESKAKVTLERNPEMLRDIKEEIRRREGRLLRQRAGDGDGFRNYYLTVYWYWDNIYPAQRVDLSGGQTTFKPSIENQILERKLNELEDIFKRVHGASAEAEWDNFQRVSLALLDSPNEYSEEVQPFELTNRRIVKM